MKDKIRKAILLMNEEIELLKCLKDVLEQQKDLIFGNDVNKFTDAIRLEDDLLGRIKVIDQERLLYLNQLSLYWNMNSQITLTKLIDLVEEPFKTSIWRIKKIFVKLIEDIRQLNLENRFLVKKSMVFVQKNLNVLKDFTKNDYVYSMNGGYGNVHTPVNRMIDRNM